MKKSMLIMTAAALLALTGCQTRLTAEKYPEVPLAIQEVVEIDSQKQIVTKDYKMASGGWRWTARSPLWAAESLKGLDIGCENEKVWLKTDSYSRDLSTNAVVMTKTIFDGSAGLAAAIGKAYASIASGGSSELASAAVSKIYSYFKSLGGDESKAVVSTTGDKLQVSDGSTCIECDAAGNCTTCSDL